MVTVRQITAQTLMGINSLIEKYGTKTETFEALAKASGVSASMIAKLHYGAKTNPSGEVIDKLTEAITYLNEQTK